jgi:hypothetical protein
MAEANHTSNDHRLESAADVDARIDAARREFLALPREQRDLAARIKLIWQWLPRPQLLELFEYAKRLRDTPVKPMTSIALIAAAGAVGGIIGSI